MPAALPSSIIGDRFERAVSFAMTSLRADRRSTHSAVARLFGVCALVLENGGTEDEGVASLVNACIDRRSAVSQLSEIRSAFGSSAASIVEGCNSKIAQDGVVPPFALYDRTQAIVERLGRIARFPEKSPTASIFFVSAAETLYDARITSEQLASGIDVFAKREGMKFGTLWSFRALADRYLAYDGDVAEPGAARHASFAREIVERVTLMAGKPVTTDELLAAFAIDDTVLAKDKGSLSREAERS